MKVKHFYHGKPLSHYCKEKGYQYRSIYQRYRYQEKKDVEQNRSKQEKIEEALERYLKRKHLLEIRDAFLKLKQENTDCKIHRDVCNTLKIDYERVRRLIYKGYHPKRIILIIWYYSDQEKDGLKTISRKKLAEANRMKPSEIQKDLYQLVAHYHMGDSEVINQIMEYEEPILKRVVNKLARYYQLSYDAKKELTSEAILQFMKALNHLVTDNIGQMIAYLNCVIKGHLIKYIKANYRNHVIYDDKLYYKLSYT